MRNGWVPAAVLLTAGVAAAAALAPTAARGAAQAAKPAAKPSATSPAASSAASVIALGKKVYAANGCATCHTIAGKGGAAGPDLTATGANPAHTAAWLATQVATPKKNNPNSAMPAFGTSIKGGNLTAIAAYLSSLKGATPAAGHASSAATSAGPNVPPPAPALVAKVEKAGGSVEAIAQNDNHLVVDFHLQGASVIDSALASLDGLKHVVELNLGKTSVTDAGLAHLKPMNELSVLHLEGTRVTDAGLANLKALHSLTYLNLYGTAVTDGGLQNLAGLTNLRRLYVWETKVTPAGADRLKAALPHADIVMGVEPAPAGAAGATTTSAAGTKK